jgi:GLPGLI family protein
MKKIFLIIVCICNFSFSQDGIVYYEYIDAIGTGGENGEIYNAYTVFSKTKSYYVVAKDSLETAISKNKAKSHYKNNDGSNNKISNGLVLTSQGEQVVCDYTTKILLSNVFDGKHTYVKETIPKFVWKIKKNEKKKIGTLNCVLGETFFRGRKYFAWYCPDIPVCSGPWKLNGLPGLILEAYDEGKNVSWKFKSYKLPFETKQDYSIRKSKKEKSIVFLTLDLFKKYCKDTIQKGYERSIILAKKFPGIKAVKEPMTLYYIESFE